ncbi:hypothetical protein [Terrisporobacter glycolicus]|uniref:hypothetical protein n=1 Tax=Terrisporobacter glycolicus TaxID=36841 RepID=UPI0034649BBB
MSRYNVQGLDELNSNINRIIRETNKEVDKELADIALDFASKSSNASPVKYGDLRGELAAPKKVYKGWKVGSSLPYTRRQHEHTEYIHPLGGGAKFLENPFNQNKDRYLRSLKEVIKNANR